MKKIWLLALVGVLIVAVLALLRANNRSLTTEEKKAPHFTSSTPETNATLAAPPPNVTIDFDFDLANGSKLDILKDGKQSVASGDITIDKNKLAMRRDMTQAAPDGLYVVEYTACWPAGSCHDGQFSFQIDRSRQSSYMDLTNQREVTVRMSQIQFSPMEIVISKGTKVTWLNDDSEIHYVNTDAHPSHTHVPGFNSKALNKGDMYSFTFDKPGAYPYHCSAHAPSMTGTIVVRR